MLLSDFVNSKIIRPELWLPYGLESKGWDTDVYFGIIALMVNAIVIAKFILCNLAVLSQKAMQATYQIQVYVFE